MTISKQAIALNKEGTFSIRTNIGIKVLKVCVRSVFVTVLFFNLVNQQVNEARADNIHYIQVSTVGLKAQPFHWAATIQHLKYGQAVNILKKVSESEAKSPGWVKVKVGNREGFLHASSVTLRRVVIDAKAAESVLVSSSKDIVLAGKGFNSEVERQHAESSQNSDYTALNVIMARKISDQEIAEFIRVGQL